MRYIFSLNYMLTRKCINNLSRVLVFHLSIIFLLSLSLHNHHFDTGASSTEEIVKTEFGYQTHLNNGMCSACRLNGNFKQTDEFKKVDHNKFGIFIAFFNNDQLIPSSDFQLNKSPRSPPTS